MKRSIAIRCYRFSSVFSKMWVSQVGCIFFIAAFLNVYVAADPIKLGGCEIPIGSKQFYRYQWPLVYKSNGDLYPTTIDEENVRKVNVDTGEVVQFSCGPNYLKHFNRQETLQVKCNGLTGNFSVHPTETEVFKANNEMDVEFACDLRVIEQVIGDVEGCSNEKWTSTLFGYVDPKEKKTFVLGGACYDTTEGKTLFAHVKLGDKDSNYLYVADKNFLNTRHPDGRYKIDLFRGLRFDNIYDYIRTQLNTKRIPFLRIGNFIDEPLLPNEQLQAVKKLGWNYFVMHDGLSTLDTLKHDIKELSKKFNLDIYIGSHGAQVLHGENNKKMTLYLQPALGEHGRFPMPAIIWIVVRQDEKATAFAVFNDAENSIHRVEHSQLCQTDCGKISWLSNALKRGSNVNSINCCSYDDLKRSIEEIPQLAGVTKMLV